jgi:hypothetical protein
LLTTHVIQNLCVKRTIKQANIQIHSSQVGR